MKKILLLFFLTLFLVSCGTSKNTSRVSDINVVKNNSKTKPIKKVNNFTKNNQAKIEAEEEIEETILENVEEKLDVIKRQIIDYAKTFEGTRYKFGGTTEAGMDCSGLVCVAFQKENIILPRISRDIATKGVSVSLKEIAEGDLVFFKTSRKYAINHVGIVVETKRGEVKFIHASTSAGVIISSLDEAYWKKAFVEVRRII
jgi:cell wall-associated NlpC family hydrolase